MQILNAGCFNSDFDVPSFRCVETLFKMLRFRRQVLVCDTLIAANFQYGDWHIVKSNLYRAIAKMGMKGEKMCQKERIQTAATVGDCNMCGY
jgi:hypothetical protein